MFEPVDLATHRHGWPYTLYEDSVSKFQKYQIPYGNNIIERFSAQNSGQLSNVFINGNYYYGIPSNDIFYPRGGICNVTKEKCGCSEKNIESDTLCKKTKLSKIDRLVAIPVVMSNNAVEYILTDLVYDVKMFTRSVTGEIKSIINTVGDAATQLIPASPVWISNEITTLQNINILQFDYEYHLVGNGVFSVFFDGRLVYQKEDRHSGEGIQTSGIIPLGSVLPGSHKLTFRLDRFGEHKPIISISNVMLGVREVVDEMSGVDMLPPISHIVFPENGTVYDGTEIVIIGVAEDGNGSGVSRVEISIDGGETWILADGTATWRGQIAIHKGGTYTILSRAIDIAGNIEKIGRASCRERV